MEAIVAATRDSADAVHLNTGLIAPGKNADFTVLDANPLENIANAEDQQSIPSRAGSGPSCTPRQVASPMAQKVVSPFES